MSNDTPLNVPSFEKDNDPSEISAAPTNDVVRPIHDEAANDEIEVITIVKTCAYDPLTRL